MNVRGGRRGRVPRTGSPFADLDATGSVSPAERVPRRWRFQFGIWALLAAMGLFSVLFAVWGELLRAGAGPDNSPRLILFVVLAVTAPLLVMIAVSLARPAGRLWRRFRRR